MQHSSLDDEEAFKQAGIVKSEADSDRNFGILYTERDIATRIISVCDDPTGPCEPSLWTLVSQPSVVFWVSPHLPLFVLLALIYLNSGDLSSNRYELGLFSWPLADLNKLSTANCACLNVVPRYHFICSWHSFGHTDTTTWIFPLP